MDAPLHWTLDYLRDLLPPELLHPLEASLTSPSSPLRTIPRALSSLASQLRPLLDMALDRLLAVLSAAPNIVSAALVLVLAAVMLQILSVVRRIMLFWTRLAFRVLWWVAVGLIASMVWQRGVERTVGDVVFWGGKLAAWGMGLLEVWLREYERAQQQQQQQQRYQGQGVYYRERGDRVGGSGWR
ncbi:hypothetical protein VTI74DRAFT_10678 [Chaetomium olivicolor]